MLPDHTVIAYDAPNGGGYTLEAVLGVPSNAVKGPDFMGWELKGFEVKNFEEWPASKRVTLLDPGPDGGEYKNLGAAGFIQAYGYSPKGRTDRMNFGGVHKYGVLARLTTSTLGLTGYDRNLKGGTITDDSGAVVVYGPADEILMSWSFRHLMLMWNRKHEKAAFVPYNLRREPHRQYHYGNRIAICRNSDFLYFLREVADGNVIFDPGLKVEGLPSKPKAKVRCPMRISVENTPKLYHQAKIVTL
jgi:hypothetical protein